MSFTSTVTTNNPNGYHLTLSTNSDEQNMYLNGYSNPDQYTTITPVTGSLTNPNPLTANTWGYAFAKQPTPNHHTTGLVTSGFNDDYSILTSLDLTANQAQTTKFAPVPNKQNPNLIKQTNSPATNGDYTTIYFGASADTSLRAGSYGQTVVWTVVRN
jgi:hypothetical protein